MSVQDWAELTLTVKVPSNVQTVVFDFSFFSSEFNQWWSSAANDAFFVLVTSKGFQGENVAKDKNGLARHHQQRLLPALPRGARPGGAVAGQGGGARSRASASAATPSQSIFGTLAGTGYDGAAVSTNDTAMAVNGSEYIYGGGSGWLTAKFPVVPGETIVMRVIVADTFDGLKDSAVLFDAVRWEQTSETGVGRPNQ